ncbi:MAG: hypothetical protein WKF82_04265 [Nocardioidaceae bacterium]
MADLTDNTAESRYEISVDGEPVGLMDHILTGDTLIAPHPGIIEKHPEYRDFVEGC